MNEMKNKMRITYLARMKYGSWLVSNKIGFDTDFASKHQKNLSLSHLFFEFVTLSQREEKITPSISSGSRVNASVEAQKGIH